MRWIWVGMLVGAMPLPGAVARFEMRLLFPTVRDNAPAHIWVDGSQNNPPPVGGTVRFTMDGADYPWPEPLQFQGSTQYGFGPLPVGRHRLGFFYGDDANYEPSAAFLEFDVVPVTQPTSISQPSVTGSGRYGETARVTAVISPPAPGVLVFYLWSEWRFPGQLPTQPAPVASAVIRPDGSASIDLHGLAISTHTIHATYNPSPGYGGSTSPAVSFLVRGAVQLELSVPANPADAGGPLVVHTPVDYPENSAVPSGQIVLREGTRTLAAALVVNRGATFIIPPGMLAAGKHSLIATLPESTYYDEAVSKPLVVEMAARPTTTKLRMAVGAQATFEVTVDSPAGSIPTGTVQLSGGGQTVTRTLRNGAAEFEPADAFLGHRVTASYPGDSIHAASTTGRVALAPLNGFSFRFGALARQEIVTVFGENLGTAPAVSIQPMGGPAKSAYLYFASPTQLTFTVPDDITEGAATLSIANPGAETHEVEVAIARTAPGIATASSDGRGAPAAQVLRVKAGVAAVESLGPLSFGGDALYLILYGTGFRNAANPVTCSAGGRTMTAVFAGAQGEFPGLDQINLPLDVALAGAGPIEMACSADGRSSNAVSLEFR